MSHFTVLVIGDDVEGQLAPYNEEIQVEPYKDYLSETTIERMKEAWKRRDEEPDAPLSFGEMLEGKDRLPPLSVDHIPDPSMEELLEWVPEAWGGEYGIDEKGMYQLTRYNPKSKWDWYQIGGRWRGYFKLKEEAMDSAETLAVVGPPGAIFDNPPRYDADHTLKRYIDIDGMRDDAGKKAGEKWDLAQTLIAHLPEALSWKQVLAKHTDDEGKTDIEEARREYHAQPRVEAMKEHDAQCGREERWDKVLLGWDGGVEEYQVTRESFVQDARDDAISTYAYVKDGEWYAPGEMGWWGISTDNEKDKRRFVREFNQLLDELPDDTLLTVVDCHI